MKTRASQILAGIVLGIILLPLTRVSAADTNSAPPRERLLMDAGWKFHLGDVGNRYEDLAKAGSSSGPASAGGGGGRGGRGGGFSDASWRTVDFPHDWVVELPFDRTADESHGFKPVGPGFATNSIGWYRKTFDVDQKEQGKRFWLEFDGVFRDCRVFLNGYEIGHHESGYDSFRYDITDVVNYGGRNQLAVRVDASKFEGWFYEGAGIYRHVWLVKTDPIAVVPDGTFVYSHFKNNIPEDTATIEIQTRLANWLTNDVTTLINYKIVASDGHTVATAKNSGKIASRGEVDSSNSTSVSAPVLWSPEKPALYKLVTSVEANGKVVDQTETEFGIRTFDWDANKGFMLNGQPYEVRGMCNHQDHAGVGSALPDGLQYFRIQRLKDMGVNAYRTSHNAPTPDLLEACDRLGMIVMDENRLLGSDEENLRLLEGQIRRDRNHASVFVWSIANEESRVHGTLAGGRIADTMQAVVHRLDPSRKVTYAANAGNLWQGIDSVIDVRGWNYNYTAADAYHKAHPQQPNVGTEQASTLCTRGIYETNRAAGYMPAYDDAGPGWGATAEHWYTFFAQRPWLSGGFVWTGFDYRGEPTPYRWPCISSHFGIMDTCGFAKDDFYYYQAWWTDKTMVHLLPHWNWAGKEGQPIDVRCFSNCEEVELFFTAAGESYARSLGRVKIPKDSHAAWKVPYAPGKLVAVGYKNGAKAGEDTVETTGVAAAVKLTPNNATINANGEDVSIITVSVTDAQGRIHPLAGNLINFEISGPGKILGVGNGDPSCHEPDVYLGNDAWKRSVFNGLAQIIVQAKKDAGDIKLTAKADGLTETTLTIHAQPCAPRPSVP